MRSPGARTSDPVHRRPGAVRQRRAGTADGRGPAHLVTVVGELRLRGADGRPAVHPLRADVLGLVEGHVNAVLLLHEEAGGLPRTTVEVLVTGTVQADLALTVTVVLALVPEGDDGDEHLDSCSTAVRAGADAAFSAELPLAAGGPVAVGGTISNRLLR